MTPLHAATLDVALQHFGRLGGYDDEAQAGIEIRDGALAQASRQLAAVRALCEDPSKIKRVTEDRRRDLGAHVTYSMVTINDIRCALDER
jgi:hypothetical protein